MSRPLLVLAVMVVFAPATARAQGATPWTPPSYADTSRFTEVELRVGADSALPATLTLPKGAGPFPAMVLVHGSGPGDRNEGVGPNRPFEDLAWGLASRGIAVLRYEKRTRVRPGQFLGKRFTVEDETIFDARDAVTRLSARPEVDPRRIVVLGHSLGGILAPRIAAEDGRPAGIVIAEGATRNEFFAMVDAQLVYLRSIHPQDSVRLDRIRVDVAHAKAFVDSSIATDTLDTRLVLGAPLAYYADLRRYDPAATTRALDLPVLVLQGGRDYQVTPEAMAAWSRAVGERSNIRIRTFPATNHLLMPGAGTPGPDEYGVPNHVAPEIVDTIAAWVRGLTPRAAPRP